VIATSDEGLIVVCLVTSNARVKLGVTFLAPDEADIRVLRSPPPRTSLVPQLSLRMPQVHRHLRIQPELR
jgi:hypothetical protein